MKKYIGTYVFLLGGILAGLAQENTTPKLSVLYSEAAVYPGLKARDAEVNSAYLEYKITKREIWPSLDFQAQNTYGTYKGLAGAVFPLAGNYNVSGLESSGTAINTLLSTTLQWDIIQFGEHRDQVKIAEIGKDQSEVSYELEDLKLKKRITQSYVSWMYAKMMLEWAQHEAERHMGLFKIAKAQADAGRSSAADSLLVKSQYKQALADEKKWLAQTQKTENKILEFTGVSLQNYKVSEYFLETSPQVPLSEDIEKHPLLEAKGNEKQQLEWEKKRINHRVLPDISLLASGMFRGAGYSGEDQWGDPYRLPVSNYLIGLGLTWKLDGFYDKGLKNRKNVQEQFRVEQEKEVLHRSLNEQENSLTEQLSQAKEEIDETKESYEAARSSYDLFKVRYESGLIDLPTLYQIEQSLQFAERSLLKAYHQYWLYWKDYAYVKNDYSVLIEAFN